MGLDSQYFSNKNWSGLNKSWYLSCIVGISQRSHRKDSSSTNSRECHLPDVRSSPCLLSLVRFLSPTLTFGSVLYWEHMQDWFAVEHRLFDREMDFTMVMNQTCNVLWCRTVEITVTLEIKLVANSSCSLLDHFQHIWCVNSLFLYMDGWPVPVIFSPTQLFFQWSEW